MTTASVLLTVTTSWSAGGENCDKEERAGRGTKTSTLVAARELRETPATRDQALRIMREWIQQNNDIKNVRQDEPFLLRFLRHKKYSIPMAQQTLLKYLSLRKYYPQVFSKLACEDSRIVELLNNGYMAVSPVRDEQGRRVIVYNMSKFNANKFTCWDMCRMHVMVYEACLDDPQDQILGFVHVGEGTGVTAAHITAWNPADFARLMKWGEQSVPMRHKAFHLINIPSAIKYIIDFAASRVSTKMSGRLNIYTNLKQLHKNIDAACLPTSYGGQIAWQDMTNFTFQLLDEQRKKLMGLDDMEILSLRGIISSRRGNGVSSDAVSVEGSFRKLEID